MHNAIDNDKAERLIGALWTGSPRRRRDVPLGCWYSISSALTLLVLLVILVAGVMHG